ncbi:dUTP diphosphatase [Peribacillus asahii]|uniref:dUTP diphosphatase n=1 Tax=Peribacillus asahii TaxID=228899 RepID=UPI0020795EF4|nr:dUTP diphosphatase [Peribacillus asahii]USK59035.1 dUTP diphosphatase [Peribacillus asahii]
MNISRLMDMQAVLDQHIEQTHGLETEDLVERKILALLVELGELANETRCFKFWSLRGPSERETILGEYVDGIHFLLSLANEQSFKPTVPEMFTLEQRNLTEQFILLYREISLFQQQVTFESFQTVFNEYIRLGHMLGFSAIDVEQAYITKNEVNHERQQQGY